MAFMNSEAEYEGPTVKAFNLKTLVVLCFPSLIIKTANFCSFLLEGTDFF